IFPRRAAPSRGRVCIPCKRPDPIARTSSQKSASHSLSPTNPLPYSPKVLAARTEGTRAMPAEKPLKIWMDGELVDKADAAVSVYDHGLLYGDGVFEGIRLYSGKIFEADA